MNYTKLRKIDFLVAESYFDYEYFGNTGILMKDNNGVKTNVVPYYSADISAAWEVVEKLYTENFCLDRVAGDYRCNFGLIDEYPEWDLADTAPLAICLAALKAKGVDYEK